MSNTPMISVIVPVYNVECYVEKCIASILEQSFGDYELLLIDDGSTDGSAKICKHAEERDRRVRYYHKSNGGLSDARNFGIVHSACPYITFIDSDDWVEPTYLEYLYHAALANETDISTCIYMVHHNGRKTPWKSLPEVPLPLSSEQALKSLLTSDSINVSANGKLYHRRLFANTTFPVGKRFEDVGTTYKLIQNANAVAVGGAPLYNYLMRDGSITHTGGDGVYDRFELAKQAYYDLKDECEEVRLAAMQYYVSHGLSVLKSCSLESPEQIRRAKGVRAEVLSHKSDLFAYGRLTARDRAALLALSASLAAYRAAWWLYCSLTGRNGV